MMAVSMLAGAASAAAAPPGPVDDAVRTLDGQVVHLSDYRGRWLLVNFWATWCGSCITELPALSALASRETRLAILGLTDEVIAPDELRAFMSAHPVSYPVALVDAKSLPASLLPTVFGVEVRPISYLIAPDGTLAQRIIGEVDTVRLAQRIRAAP